MAQIKEIKKRIKSIESTQKVTHAMELVAAAKMRKAQFAALSGRPYSTALHEILSEVKTKSQRAGHPLLFENNVEKQLLILVSTDRGLAGGLNINLFREIIKSELKNVIYISVGKKGRDFVAKTGQNLSSSWESEEKNTLDLARTITKMATEAYVKKEVGKVILAYPHFDSTMKQTPNVIQILPIKLNNKVEEKPEQLEDLLFEPTADQILEQILPHHILTQIYQVLLEAKASEHSARMVAMKNATDAAGDLVDDLTLTYNQARQEAITKELLDITTAQKAFE